MPIFVSFVMGAKDSYFFNSPRHWAWRNLSPDVEALFTKQPPIKDVIEFALGENGTYFISYRDHDGEAYCRHYNLPNPLTEYLYCGHPRIIRDLNTLSLSIGPWESYYAHDKTTASWSNLPPPLEKALEDRLVSQDAWKTVWKDDGREAPSFVTLGANGSYFMRTVKGGGSWDLKDKDKGNEEGLRGTNKFLEDAADFSGVAGLYLFPQQPSSYILLLTNGKAYSNLPEHTWDDYNKMAPALPPLIQTMSPIPCIPQVRPASQVLPLQQQLPIQPQPQAQLRGPPQSQVQANPNWNRNPVVGRPAGAYFNGTLLQRAGAGAVAGTGAIALTRAAIHSYSSSLGHTNMAPVMTGTSDTSGVTGNTDYLGGGYGGTTAGNDMMASSNIDSVNSFINGVFGGAIGTTAYSGDGYGTSNDLMVNCNAFSVDSAVDYSV